MRIHQWITIALTACVALASSSSATKRHGTNTACGKFRVRQSWTQFTSDEKKLYKGALISAMKTREFNEFAKIHMENMSGMQAHNTCAFLLWHKRYLLAYENMLRSQGPEYACVTVPYWDVMKDYANMIDGNCKDIYSCSSIVRDFGGTLNSPPQSRTMDGATVNGACYESFAGDVYCDDNEKCGCLPRGDLTAQLPSSCGYEGLFNQIAYSPSFAQFTRSLQQGLHNEVHGTMGGFMGTYTSPVDPLFWSWHATVDMMWYIYHQCHVSSSMTDADIRKSVYGFLQTGECRYTNDAPHTTINDKIVQQSMSKGVMSDATKNPLVGKYFADLPSTIGDYVSFTPVGEYAYKYIVPEAFNQKLLQSPDLCRVYYNEWSKKDTTQVPTTPVPAATTPAPGATTAAPTTPGATTPAPAATTPAPGATTPAPGATTAAPTTPGATTATPSFDFDNLDDKDKKDKPVDDAGKNATAMPLKDANATTAPVPVVDGGQNVTAKPSTSTDDRQKGKDVTTKPLTPMVDSPTDKPVSSSDGSQLDEPEVGDDTDPCKGNPAVQSDGDFDVEGSKYWDWYSESRKQLDYVFPGNITEIARQMEYVGCLTFGETYGIKNFTEQFMKDFHLEEARPKCQQQVEEVHEGKSQVVLETTAFNAQTVQVKEGVTPAPPVNPDDVYKQFEQKVSLESGLSIPTSAASVVKTMSMMTVVVVASIVSMWWM